MEEIVSWEELSSEKKKFNNSLVLLWKWARKNKDYNYYPEESSIGDVVERLPLSLSSHELTDSDDIYFAPVSQTAFATWAPTRLIHPWLPHQPQLGDYGVVRRRFYDRDSMFEVLNALKLNIGSKLYERPGLIHLTEWTQVWNFQTLYISGSGSWPDNREWRTVDLFDTTDSRPHMICTMYHDCRGEDNLVRSEFITILEVITGRMRLKRLQENRIFPVLLLSVLAPRKARIVQAHFDLVKLKLVIRRSPCYNFENPDEAQKNLDLFLRWVMSCPIGDTVAADTPYYSKGSVAVREAEELKRKEHALSESRPCEAESHTLKDITGTVNMRNNIPSEAHQSAAKIPIYPDAEVSRSSLPGKGILEDDFP